MQLYTCVCVCLPRSGHLFFSSSSLSLSPFASLFLQGKPGSPKESSDRQIGDHLSGRGWESHTKAASQRPRPVSASDARCLLRLNGARSRLAGNGRSRTRTRRRNHLMYAEIRAIYLRARCLVRQLKCILIVGKTEVKNC